MSAKAQRLSLREHSMCGKSKLLYMDGIPSLWKSAGGDEVGKAGKAGLVTLS